MLQKKTVNLLCDLESYLSTCPKYPTVCFTKNNSFPVQHKKQHSVICYTPGTIFLSLEGVLPFPIFTTKFWCNRTKIKEKKEGRLYINVFDPLP